MLRADDKKKKTRKPQNTNQSLNPFSQDKQIKSFSNKYNIFQSIF